MRLTNYDLAIWARYNAPKWARPLIGQSAGPGIHAAINGHAPTKHDNRHHAMNTCHLVRSMTRRADLRLVLYHLGTTISPPADPRRSRRCMRWLSIIDQRRRML